MKILLRIILAVLASGLIFLIYYSINNFFPWPFNHINFLFLIIILAGVINPNRQYLWYFFPLSILLESFTSKPFGIVSLTLLISLLVINWLLKNIFTNRSLVIVFLSAIIGLFIYRGMFLILLLIINFLERTANNYITLTEMLINSGLEILATAILTTLIYFGLSLLFKGLNPKYLSNNERGARL